MSNFIKLNSLHNSNKDFDCVIYVRADEITQIMSAHAGDRKMRSEINSVVMTRSGAHATVENPATILEKIKEATI